MATIGSTPRRRSHAFTASHRPPVGRHNVPWRPSGAPREAQYTSRSDRRPRRAPVRQDNPSGQLSSHQLLHHHPHRRRRHHAPRRRRHGNGVIPRRRPRIAAHHPTPVPRRRIPSCRPSTAAHTISNKPCSPRRSSRNHQQQQARHRHRHVPQLPAAPEPPPPHFPPPSSPPSASHPRPRARNRHRLKSPQSSAPAGRRATRALRHRRRQRHAPVNPPAGVTAIVVLFPVVAPGANDKLAIPGSQRHSRSHRWPG